MKTLWCILFGHKYQPIQYNSEEKREATDKDRETITKSWWQIVACPKCGDILVDYKKK